MARLNTPSAGRVLSAPITTLGQMPDTRTYEGGAGYSRGVKSELFLLGVSLLAGESDFYESAAVRIDRFTAMIRDATLAYPTWTAAFLCWLRHEGNIRTASIIGAAEYLRAVSTQRCATLNCGNPVNHWDARTGWVCTAHRTDAMAEIRPRKVIDSVLLRADEPGEMVAYWLKNHGRALPMALKRGVADAVLRLGTERNVLKWDSATRGVRMADVLNLTHPADRANCQRHQGAWQNDLFWYVTTLPYDADAAIPDSLGVLTAHQVLMRLPVEERRAALDPQRLRYAGITWEGLAGWLQGPMDAQAWEVIIPSMGYMSLLRNLRNFDQAGISSVMADRVAARLADSEQVALSRQFPYRFYSAYRAVPSDRWAMPLEAALTHSLGNIPYLTGTTQIYCDTSSSMGLLLSDKGTIRRVDVAALFAVALAYRCDPYKVELIGYATGSFPHTIDHGGSVLRQLTRFANRIGEVGHGTYTASAIARNYAGQDRVVIITDEQCADNPAAMVPSGTTVYTVNLGGYRAAHLPAGPRRYTLGGLGDATFKIMAALEAGQSADWSALFGTEILGE